jgi:hypothetical protein
MNIRYNIVVVTAEDNLSCQSWVVVLMVVVVDAEGVVWCRHSRSVVVRLWQRQDGGMRSN